MKHIVILLSFACYTSAKVFQHTIMRVESTRERLIRTGKWDEFMKYTKFLENQTKTDVFASLTRKAIFGVDLKFSVLVTVGNPGQLFSVVLDTASRMFWIPDINCGKPNAICRPACDDAEHCLLFCDRKCCQPRRTVLAEECNKKRKFDSKKSYTYIPRVKSFDYPYANGNVKGFYGLDMFEFIGDNKNLSFGGLTFGQAVELPPEIVDSSFDGVLGLGLTSEGGPDVDLPIIHAINDNFLDLPVFTIYFKYSIIINKIGGAITYGGYDETNCGKIITTVKSVSDSQWKFYITGIQMQGITLIRKFLVISDTATPYLVMPNNLAYIYINIVGAIFDEKLNAFKFSCGTDVPDMKIFIGVHPFKIPGFVFREHVGLEDGFCLFRVLINKSKDESIILGTPFIESYCHYYNYENKTISFASHKNPFF